VGGGGELEAWDTSKLLHIQADMHSHSFLGLHLGRQEIRLRHFHQTLELKDSPEQELAAGNLVSAWKDCVGGETSDLGPGQTHALEHAGVANLLYSGAGEFFAVENVCNHVALPLTEAVLDCCELE
jgi:hypothetical protein